MRVAVTAATGRTGGALVAALRAAGLEVHATARSERVAELAGDGVTTAVADLLDTGSLIEAFAGADAVVHYNPGLTQSEVAQGTNAIDAAQAAGARRFVFVSVYHPQIEFLLNHEAKARVEDYLVGSGLDYTILQPMHYVDNFDPRRIADEGVLRLQYSLDRKLSFVALEDVAEAAALVLTQPGHVYASYPLCGPDLLSGDEVAAIIAEEAARPVAGEQVPIEAFLAMISRHRPLPWYTADMLRRLFTYYDVHGITGNPNVLRWVLGREPTSVRDYVRRRLQAS